MVLQKIARGAWIVQILVGLAALIVAIMLAKGQVFGSTPATIGYAAFCGAFVAVVGGIGLFTTYHDKIPEKILLGVDALAAFCALAGGIAYAVGLNGVKCSDIQSISDKVRKDLLSEGMDGDWPGLLQRACGDNDVDDGCQKKALSLAKTRCNHLVADQALVFISFGAAAATAAILFLMWRKGRGSHF